MAGIFRGITTGIVWGVMAGIFRGIITGIVWVLSQVSLGVLLQVYVGCY